MGYLTTVVIYNDALGEFEKSPHDFAVALFDGIRLANRHHLTTDVPFKNHSNYLTIHPSRHADDITVFLHYGNSVSNINAYAPDFKDLMENRPDLAREFIDVAIRHLEYVKSQIKDK